MKWLYKNKEINEITDLPQGAFGFIYQTTHLPTGKKYIGKKSLIYNLKKKLGKKVSRPSISEIRTNKYREKKGLPPIKRKN